MPEVRSIILDDLDFLIITKIYNNKSYGTWNLAEDYVKSRYGDLTKKGLINKECMKIISRLERLSNIGIILITRDEKGKRVYNFIKENIKMKEYKFPTGIHKAVLLRINYKWNIYQIDN